MIFIKIQETRDIELTSDIASKIYAGKQGEPFFDDLVNHMTSGTCKVLVLSDIDAVEKLRSVVGAPDPTIGKIYLEIHQLCQKWIFRQT